MNVILFTKQRGHLHQISLAQLHIAIPMVLGVALMLAAVFGSGYYFAVTHGAASPDAMARAWQGELSRQEEEIRKAAREAEDNVQALSIRLGKLQAEVIRLEALGQRLTQMAGLEEGEFDFAQAPAMGGPLEEGDDLAQYTTDFSKALDQLAERLEHRGEQLGVLEQLMLNQRVQDEVQPSGKPVTVGWISSHFGVRSDPFSGRRSRHYGTDFAARDGTPVKAVASGVVTWAGDRYGYGILVEINHGNGYRTRYAHNRAALVEVGDTVKRGDVISEVGSSGRATGPHLHFEVLHNGRAIDPSEFIHAASESANK